MHLRYPHGIYERYGMRTAWFFALFCAVLWLPENIGASEAGPGRIISLAPSITRELYDLGAQDRLMGVTAFRPDTARTKEIVGSLTKLNFEKIFSLQPDLILASKDSNTKTDIEKLRALGLNVVVFEGCESLSCMCSEFERLASLVDKPGVAGIILREARKRMHHIRSSIKDRKPLKIFWQIGSNPLVTISDTTFSGEYIRLAGCENIFADAPVRYPRINIEEVITRNPDVILVVTEMEQDGSSAIWADIPQINAVKHDRVYTLSADFVCQPTPRMFVKGFETVVKRLYPGAL